MAIDLRPPPPPHEHLWVEVLRDSNADRTRTLDRCDCGASRWGCFAKRLDDQGERAWGPVGVQTFKLVQPDGHGKGL